jgi:hypothetical protein
VLHLDRLSKKDIRGQCYKTFHGRDLRIFEISLSVCPWQEFPAYSIACGQGQEHTLEWSPRKVPALQTNIRLDWKGLPGTNALAYHEKS